MWAGLSSAVMPLGGVAVIRSLSVITLENSPVRSPLNSTVPLSTKIKDHVNVAVSTENSGDPDFHTHRLFTAT